MPRGGCKILHIPQTKRAEVIDLRLRIHKLRHRLGISSFILADIRKRIWIFRVRGMQHSLGDRLNSKLKIVSRRLQKRSRSFRKCKRSPMRGNDIKRVTESTRMLLADSKGHFRVSQRQKHWSCLDGGRSSTESI